MAAPAVPFPVRREDLDGLPVYWAEAPEGIPFLAGLLFRVGRVDETVRTSGITHLVEHLALPARVPGSVQFNGTVDLTTTTFWATGEREPVLEFLRELVEAIADLPLPRLERERSILHTEASSREHGNADVSLMLRYGARGPGMAWIDEFGLAWLGQAEVAAWAADRFTAGNCALYCNGPPPESLPALPDGDRFLPPEPQPVDYVRYPSVFAFGPPGGVAISLAPPRSSAFLLAAGTLHDRVVQRLRIRLGLTYETDWWWDALTDDVGASVLSVDCLPENLDAARNALLTELEELAYRGPTDAERESDLDQWALTFRDPNELPGRLHWTARNELFGGEARTELEVYEERAAVTRAAAAEALAEAAGGLLLLVPEEASRPAGRFTEYPMSPPFRVDGKRYRRGGLPFRREGNERELVVGEEGITLLGTDYANTVRFDRMEGMLAWADGTRTLAGYDATFVTVDPAIWRNGKDAVARIDAAVASELRVDMEPDSGDPELDQAAAAFDEGDPQRALPLIERVVVRRPDDALAQAQLAAVYAALERWPDALAAADRAHELDPTLEWADRVRANALWHTGRRAAALAVARETMTRGASDLQALVDFSWFEAEAGDPGEARRVAERAVELYPDEGQAWFALGWAAMSAADWPRADEALRKAVELEPESSMWHNNVGWLLLQRGQVREAMKTFDRALALDRSNGYARYNRVVGLNELGRVDEARKLHTRLLEADLASAAGEDRSADALAERARLLAQLGRLREAREHLAAAVELEPGLADLVTGLVELDVDLGEYESARSGLAQARELEPEGIDTLYSQAYLAAAERDEALATAAAQDAERLHPSHRSTSDIAGYAALCRGDWDEAAARFRTTLERVPLRSCSHAWLAVALRERGETREADEHAAVARRRCGVRCLCASIRALEER